MAVIRNTSRVEVNVRWVNEKQVRMQFAEAANKLDNIVLPLAVARQVIIDNVRQRFDQKNSPEGTTWPAWAKNYQPAHDTNPASGMLEQEGTLRGKMLDPASYPIRGNALFLSRSAIETNYGEIHQRGSNRKNNRLPKRQFIETGETGLLQTSIYRIFQSFASDALRVFSRRGQIIAQSIEPGSTRFGKGARVIL